MRTKLATFVLLIAQAVSFPARAQVTVGLGEVPETGALLQLKDIEKVATDGINATKGLGLPRVSLSSETDLYPMFLATPSNPASTTPSAEYSSAAGKSALDASHTGLTVYNMNTTAPFVEGVYVWDGEKWVRTGGQEWFYLPSFNLDISTTGTKSIDLYNDVYKKQFNRTGNTKFIASAGFTLNTATNRSLYTTEQLAFAVTDYDETVINNISITAEGVMSYNVLKTESSPSSYINIVCVVK